MNIMKYFEKIAKENLLGLLKIKKIFLCLQSGTRAKLIAKSGTNLVKFLI